MNPTRCFLILLFVGVASSPLIAKEPPTIVAKADLVELEGHLMQILPVIKSSTDLKTIQIAIQICNVGDRPFSVHTDRQRRLSASEAWLYQKGKKVPGNGVSHQYWYGSRGTRSLAPGEFVYVDEGIHVHYHSLKPGRYEIRVSYDSVNLPPRLQVKQIQIYNRLVGYLDVSETPELDVKIAELGERFKATNKAEMASRQKAIDLEKRLSQAIGRKTWQERLRILDAQIKRVISKKELEEKTQAGEPASTGATTKNP